jgi:nitrogen regulatory protein P-II 1
VGSNPTSRIYDKFVHISSAPIKFIIYQTVVCLLKKIEAVIAHQKIDAVVEALKKIGVGGFTILDAKGWGKADRSQMTGQRGTSSYIAGFNIKNYIIIVVDDSIADKVITTIVGAAGTDSPGDGKIFISTVEDAIDIGSKQKGIHAI